MSTETETETEVDGNTNQLNNLPTLVLVLISEFPFNGNIYILLTLPIY